MHEWFSAVNLLYLLIISVMLSIIPIHQYTMTVENLEIILIGLYMTVGGVAETIFCQQSACTSPLLNLMCENVHGCVDVWCGV